MTLILYFGSVTLYNIKSLNFFLRKSQLHPKFCQKLNDNIVVFRHFKIANGII